MGASQFVLVPIAVLGVAACQGPGDGEFRLNANTGIEGSGLPGDPLRFADAGLVTGAGTAGTLPKFSSATTVSPSIISEADGGIGIGRGASSYAGLSVARGIRGEPYFVDNSAYMGQPAADSIGFYTSGGMERMRINANGGIGIGRTASSEKLEVAGNIRAYSDDPTARRGFVMSDPNGSAVMFSGGGLGNGFGFYTKSDITNVRMVIAGDGSVGVGVSNPQAPLHVSRGSSGIATFPGQDTLFLDTNGNSNLIHIAAGANASAGIIFSGTGGDRGEGNMIYEYPTHSMYFSTGPRVSEKMRITSAGRVGIGTSNPMHVLEVNGDIYSGDIRSTGCVHVNSFLSDQGMLCGSSRTLKQGMRDLSGAEAIAAVQLLRPSHFAYKANPTEPKLGFIAEDVPDLVAMNDRKSLDPMEFAALLTKVVQEQQKDIAAQKQENSELRRQIATQRERLDRLEAALGRRAK